jgi:2OG-Fe(II) oxygenase superfamily
MRLDYMNLLDADKLSALGGALAKSYQEGEPFPHIVIDNFLDPEIFAEVLAAFPGPECPIWYKFKSGPENLKLQSRDLRDLPPVVRALVTEFNGAEFVKFLQEMTGIAGLVPDPHLYGGGLHQTLGGGHLGVHVDYNYHEDWALDRRLNAILYVNDGWDEAWGGQLEFWDAEVKSRSQAIAPIGNRLVVFSTSERSWHGHPDPLQTPPGITRKSIALYYYSNGRPDEERAGSHNTLFKERPGERYRMTARDWLRELTPPIVARWVRAAR